MQKTVQFNHLQCKQNTTHEQPITVNLNVSMRDKTKMMNKM